MHQEEPKQNIPTSGVNDIQHKATTRGLVLMGGGARTAYQAGALQALAQLLSNKSSHPPSANFPFQILVGTSAGALNATYLASRALDGLEALTGLGEF
jgi:NTE family protein